MRKIGEICDELSYKFSDKSKFSFIFDIDGTILNEDGIIDPFWEKEVNKLIGIGCGVTIATGRSILTISDVLKNVKPTMPIICLDGQFIGSWKEKIYCKNLLNINMNWLHHIQKDLFVFFEDPYNIYAPSQVSKLLFSMSFRYPRKSIITKDLRGREKPLRIFFRIKEEGGMLPTKSEIEANMRQKVNVHYYPDGKWLVISPSKIDKGVAFDIMCELGYFNADSTIFFGDDNNDIEIMKKVGMGVAMGNASDDLKKVANYQTLSLEECGVSSFLHIINSL